MQGARAFTEGLEAQETSSEVKFEFSIMIVIYFGNLERVSSLFSIQGQITAFISRLLSR